MSFWLISMLVVAVVSLGAFIAFCNGFNSDLFESASNVTLEVAAVDVNNDISENVGSRVVSKF